MATGVTDVQRNEEMIYIKEIKQEPLSTVSFSYH